MTTGELYRHGDILLRRVGERPQAAKQRQAEGTQVILARGETTGHAHVLTGGALALWELGNRLWVELPAGGTLTHEEHGVVALPPGTFEIVRQRVYTPEEIHVVVD